MKNFDHYGIAYEFMDCCASLRNLSIFLEMRDENPVFYRLKAIHDIGFPSIVRDGRTISFKILFSCILYDLMYKS